MQKVSQAWKDNQNSQLVSESFVEVSIDITDPVSTDDAVATDNGSVAFSNTEDIIGTSEEDITSYATLEQNIWVLDGSTKVLPNTGDYDNAGYVGQVLSGENGEFSSPPTVTINFNDVHEIPVQGLTITWSATQGDYPTDFTVRAYNGDEVVGEKIVTGNTNIVSIVLFDIIHYDRITIVVNKWCLPHRRARIEDLLIGVRKVYSKNDIFSFTHSQEIDVISASLPKGTVSFEVNNYDRAYDIHNMEGLAKYLTERQEIKVRYGYKIGGKTEWIDGGVYYLSSWESKENSNSAKFEANLRLDNLTMIYDQGVYIAEGRSLYDLTLDVLTFANIPLADDGGVRWVVDESLKNITTSSPLPTDTVANCLQIIANAGCCILYQDRKGILHIEKRDYIESDYSINPTNSFNKPSVALSKPIKNIKVSVYGYEVGESKLNVATTGPVRLSKKPVWDFYLPYSRGDKECLVTNCELTARYTSARYTITKQNFYGRHAELQVVYNGVYPAYDDVFTVKGNVLEISSYDTNLSVGEEGEEISIDNPLITSEEHAMLVAEWVKNALIKRQTVSLSWRADPRLDVGDVIENVSTYNTNNVIMTKVDYSYNGAFRGTGEGRVM